jgi:hypothetical protein
MFRYATLTAILLGALCGPVVAPCSAGSTIDIDDYSYAAVAYAPSTGSYAYAYGYYTRADAERAALARCKPTDARIVCWVKNGFCALALGDDTKCWGVGHRWGNGASNSAALDRALSECSTRTTGSHVVLCLSSDGQVIQERTRSTASAN